MTHFQKLWYRGDIQKLRWPIFALFWPPTYLWLTFVDIWPSTYLMSTLTYCKINPPTQFHVIICTLLESAEFRESRRLYLKYINFETFLLSSLRETMKCLKVKKNFSETKLIGILEDCGGIFWKMSTLTLNEPCTHLPLTFVDIWLSTYLPPLVNVVFECPLIDNFFGREF